MFGFLIFIFLIVLYSKSYIYNNHNNKKIVVKKNGIIYKTIYPFEYAFINPFTDTHEVVKLLPTEQVNKKTNDSHRSFKLNIPIFSLDRKSATIFTRGSYTITNYISTTTVEDMIAKIVKNYYSQKIFSQSSLEVHKSELNILDKLRDKFTSYKISIDSFDLSLTEFNENFEKSDCVHYEYSPIETYKKKAISNLSREKNVDAIVDYSIETSDNPIREKISINSALHNTLNNMDCNIDPIDNK
ncbi:MAG: hypothetical protein HFJ46_07970 [Clostridia bacterium]|nr:hypothetical protein [Clostridia bacterium]